MANSTNLSEPIMKYNDDNNLENESMPSLPGSQSIDTAPAIDDSLMNTDMNNMSISAPSELPPSELPPSELPSSELPPNELPPSELPSSELPPSELPPSELPPSELPPSELPPSELPSSELPSSEMNENEDIGEPTGSLDTDVIQETEEPPMSEQITESNYIPTASNGEITETKQMVHDDKILKDATNYRKKIAQTKKKLPTMDDHKKDEIRNGVIREFINILKISKHATTRKKYGRKINNMRNAFHDTLNLLNGTAKRRPKRKSRKQKQQEPIVEPFTQE
jgi:hypothetical protein